MTVNSTLTYATNLRSPLDLFMDTHTEYTHTMKGHESLKDKTTAMLQLQDPQERGQGSG